MANRWEHATDGYLLRFFSPEQVDEILRDGSRRGRQGSHSAIERILKHEPDLQRSELWRRLRWLKDPGGRQRGSPATWTSEDEQILRRGYQDGWQGKRYAVRQLLRSHPDWRPHVVWQHARKIGLVQTTAKRGRERSRARWTEEDHRVLIDLAGYKNAGVIAKILHRSEAAIRYHLATLGKSSRVHVEGYARSELARELHLSTSAIQRLIVEGLLEVRDPRITRESLDRLHESPQLAELQMKNRNEPAAFVARSDRQTTLPWQSADSPDVSSTLNASSASSKVSRGKRAWAEVAASLGLSDRAFEALLVRGVLKFYDATITEKSLRNLCRRYGSVIERTFLSREAREWLTTSMDWVPTSGDKISGRFTHLRKHAAVVRSCTKCGRSVRGNAFFRHSNVCMRLKEK